MKWLDKGLHFNSLPAGENLESSFTREKEKSNSRARKIRSRMCNIVQQQKKRANQNNRISPASSSHLCWGFLKWSRLYSTSSSTAPSSGDEGSVFTSSTVVSTSSSIQHTNGMTEKVPLSPNWLEESEGCRRETKGNFHVDSFAKPSKSMKRSKMEVNITGDRDIWEERILVNKRTGEQRSFFYSTNTGFRLMDEPPTGASCVIYLEN